MPKASIAEEARAIKRDILQRQPGGARLDRRALKRLIVVSLPGKSEEAADRIIKTGALAGLWETGFNPLNPRAGGWVVVPPDGESKRLQTTGA